MTSTDDSGPGFGPWWSLTNEDIQSQAPDAPAAVQVSRADKQLVRYPSGKSTMVFYFFAARSAREALLRLFSDEIAEPGVRGQGPLAFRFLTGGDAARAHLEDLFDAFVARFGAPPMFHPRGDDGDAAGG